MKAVIDKWSRIPFSYGLDCCQFAGECIESVTGNNPMHQFSYENQAEAEAIIRKYGSLEAAVTSVLGKPTKKGMIALVHSAGREMVGVIYNARILLRTKNGITDWSLDRAIKVWGV